MHLKAVTVYCSSSSKIPELYLKEARALGAELASKGITLVYGGGRAGSMGQVADGALGAKGRVVGYIPAFMKEVEWAHEGLSELDVVETMHERKAKMIRGSDAIVALPGGSGTWEEFFEAVTLKRLGKFTGPIILVNTEGFYAPFLQMLERAINEKFMNDRHRSLWTVARNAADALSAIERSEPWDEKAIRFAV